MSFKKTETYRTFSSEETKKVGYEMALTLVRGSAAAASAKKNASVFALRGDLGAGKTTFVQGFLKGMGSKKRVTSPTFILMRRHTVHRQKIKNVFHIDAYRIKKPEHLAALELDVILDGPQNVVLIEWPEQAKRFLLRDTIWLRFKYGKKENERIITLTRPAQSRSVRKIKK